MWLFSLILKKTQEFMTEVKLVEVKLQAHVSVLNMNSDYISLILKFHSMHLLHITN